MVRAIIDKLKIGKKKLQSSTIDTENVDNKLIEEQMDFEIIVSTKNNISRIEISDYISMSDYIKKMKSCDEYHILELLYNCVLWNGAKQKVNKGIYYVILSGNIIYNLLFTDEQIKIDERTKIDFDEESLKENIIQERVITFYMNKNQYRYYSAKHDKIGDTFYTRYYDENRAYSLGTLDLSTEEAYDEINSLIYNLEGIEGIENILDIDFLKEQFLVDLSKNSFQRKKTL